MENIKDKNEKSFLFVIFGGTGDLAKRKLIPALLSLYQKNLYQGNFALVAIGRRDYDSKKYAGIVKEFIESEKISPSGKSVPEDFINKLFYYRFDFAKEPEKFGDLDLYLKETDKKTGSGGNRIFYLAVAPELMEGIADNLHINGMLSNKPAWQRVMIEKPFGTSLESAKKLNSKITKFLGEENIFRIDHYLGKDMIQNLVSIRFGNTIFEPLWEKKYIDHIQITLSETLGVEDRGGYYEKSGILQDMVQSHILQVISLICMDPPESLDSEHIKDEKVKVMKSLRYYDRENGGEKIVFGQYGRGSTEKDKCISYREENRVADDSLTPTFVALKLFVDNKRWKDVPFYIRSGKRMKEKKFEIAVVFKLENPGRDYPELTDRGNDVLYINIQPVEGIKLSLNVKDTETDNKTRRITLDCSEECMYRQNTPEAYERLIKAAAQNNHSMFARWDELMYSWMFVENINFATEKNDHVFPNYESWSDGPESAVKLIENDRRKWL